MSNGEECAGFYLLADDLCREYLETEATNANDDTSSPTAAGTSSPSASPTAMADELCFTAENDAPCLQVDTFADIRAAILASPTVVFCGGKSRISAPEHLTSLLSNSLHVRLRHPKTIERDYWSVK